jgi:hypothetical protein
MSPPEKSVTALAKSIADLARQAVAAYAPVVDSIISDQSTNISHIERALDGLLDFCFDPEALDLYKMLCRYYYRLDPAAAVYYVRAYREMWDSEPHVASNSQV